jgi:hypothetical protein
MSLCNILLNVANFVLLGGITGCSLLYLLLWAPDEYKLFDIVLCTGYI